MLGPLVSFLMAFAVSGVYLAAVKHAPWWGAMIFGFVTLVASFFILSRKVMGKIEPIMAEANKHIQAGRVDPAIATLERAMRLSMWHPLLGSQLHAQIGQVQYVSDKLTDAEPHLRKSSKRVWTSRAMLGCTLFKKKDAEGMKAVFEEVAADKKHQKESLFWTVYAYCARELVGKEAAVGVLERAHALMRGDERIEKNLERVKEGKGLKTIGYGQMWLQFKLGDPPKQQQTMQRGGYSQMHPALRGGGGGRGKRRR